MTTDNLVLVGYLLGCGLLFIGLSLPLLKRRVPMNWFYGVRFKQAFISDDIWYELNHFGAKQLFGAGIVLVVLAMMLLFVSGRLEGARIFVVLMAPAVAALGCAFISYRYGRRWEDEHGKTQ